MTERLQRALAHIDVLSPEVQEQLAQEIEDMASPVDTVPQDFFGIWRDLADDEDFLEVLDQCRHETPASLPIRDEA